MNAPTDAPVKEASFAATLNDHTEEASRSKHLRLIVIAGVALLLVGGVLLLHRRPNAEAPAPLEPVANTPAARVPVPAIAPLVSPTDPAPRAATPPLEPTAATPGPSDPAPERKATSTPASVAQRFDSVDAALSSAQKALDKQSAQIDALQQALAALTEKLPNVPAAKAADKTASAESRPDTERPARTSARRSHPARIARTSVPHGPNGEVLAVDTWNGQPVVTVQAGGTMRFLSPGDAFGGYTLDGADPATQRAAFRAEVVDRSIRAGAEPKPARAKGARAKAADADDAGSDR